MGDGDTRCAAAGAPRFSKHGAPIGAVGKHVTRIIRQRRLAVAAVMSAARRDRALLDQRRVGVILVS
jgi:hypothetical protein